jgi:tetratricopeptide (TPR) repeat protein
MSAPGTEEKRYRAFISYNHQDWKFAKRLHTRLENFSFADKATPGKPKPLFPIFIDNNELKAGSKLDDAIQEALRKSDFLIVICSGSSVKSKWVKAELALMRETRTDSKIIGVIPPKGGNEAHLAELMGAGSEHLAADFRKGKNHALQLSKIAATILNVELDELYQRAARRKNKQMLGLGAALSVIATLMSGLAANAYLAEKEAVRQRQQSEEVIAFMIDEFRDDLEKLDQLDLLSGVGAKAQDYFENRDLDALSDSSVLLQSRTLRQLSDVDEKRGEIGLAKERIIGAHAASSLMMRRRPDQIETLKEHAENSDYWGYLEYQLGHLKKAKDLFQTAKDTYEIGRTLYPNDADIAWKESTADQNIGIMLLQMGRANDARPYIERTLRIYEEEYNKESLNEERLYGYVNTYTWYIRTLPDDTPISFLYDTRQKQLNLFDDMRQKGARTILNQAEKLNVERAVVILLLQSGRDDEAEALMYSVQKAFKTLLKHDPNNVGWRRHLMRSKLTLALLHHKYGRLNERNSLIDETLKLGEKPNGEKWGLTTDIDRRLNRLTAYRLFDEGKPQQAFNVLNLAQKKIEDHWKGDYNPRVKYTLASLKSFKAELLKKTGRVDEANTEHDNILNLLSGKDSYSVAEQKLQYEAYTELGQVDKAMDLQTKLRARGVALD